MATRAMGLNIGSDQNSTDPNDAPYAKVQNTADLAYLRPLMDRVRVGITYGQDINDLNNLKQLALDAKALGFYVQLGITAGMEANASAYYSKGYYTDVVNLAKWCATNHIDEFTIGNEEDWHALNEKVLKPKTPKQIRDDVRAIVSKVRAVYSGQIVYCTAQGTLDDWIKEGIGGLDRIYFNVYDTRANFQGIVTKIVKAFGVDHAGLSEWAAENPYPNGMTDAKYRAEIMARRDIVVASGLPAYLYTWRDTEEWAFKVGNTLRPGFTDVFGAATTPPDTTPPTTPTVGSFTGTFKGSFTGTFLPS